MRVRVIGESCSDVYIYGSCPRLSSEAPVPVFYETGRTEAGGMALNVMGNLQALGIECDLVTQASSIFKTRYVETSRNHPLLRVDDDGLCEPFSGDCKFDGFDGVVIVDYNKGFLPANIMASICSLNKPVFVDTKKPLEWWCRNATFLKLNEIESRISGHFLDRHHDILDKTIITLGGAGCLFNGRRYPVEPVDVMDVAGAGDTFFAGFIASYLMSKNVDHALRFANECAREVVQRRGTVVVRPHFLTMTL
jgi:D-glycero-beta-D-manno-heptose-7-phosphate kinase